MRSEENVPIGSKGIKEVEEMIKIDEAQIHK